MTTSLTKEEIITAVAQKHNWSKKKTKEQINKVGNLLNLDFENAAAFLMEVIVSKN